MVTDVDGLGKQREWRCHGLEEAGVSWRIEVLADSGIGRTMVLNLFADPPRSREYRMAANQDIIESCGTDTATLIEVRFKPLWEYIEAIRHLGKSFCMTTYGEGSISDRAQLIIQEALENAVKYSQGGPKSDLEILISSSGGAIEISVGSKPTAEDLASLREELSWINAKDPQTAYLEAFMRAAENPEGSARLGLARMRYEGGVELSMVETEDGRIRLTARGAL